MQADQVLCIRQGARAGSRWVPVCAQAGRGRCRQAGRCLCMQAGACAGQQVHVQAGKCPCRQVPVRVADACGQVLVVQAGRCPEQGRQVLMQAENMCAHAWKKAGA